MGDPTTAGVDADTSNEATWPSVDDACPTEEGGPIARTGFSYQDEVAVGFFIDMLCDPSLVKIHCESHDDILLLRSSEAGYIAEFVQVKGGEPDKLWSVADLCYRKAASVGSSIFEVSLARDQHRELSRFRIVTHRPVVAALEVLTFPLDAPGRESNGTKFLELFAGIDGYCPGFQSAKGNGAKYWVGNCLWDVRADKSNIERANLLALIKLSAQQKLDLLPEHVDLLLGELRAWAKRAGEARWHPNRDEKIITRDAICTWWKERTTEIRQGAALQGGGKLADKLREIGAGEEIIALAIEMRRDYAAATRNPRYMADDHGEWLQQRVKSELMSLRTRYSAGQLDIDGISFLMMCLDRLDEMNGNRPIGEEDRAAYLKGCMYDITDRCLHRFASPRK